MMCLKKFFIVVLIMILGCGYWASRATAETGKKIILFKDGVTQQMRSEYVQEWSTAGVVSLMDLPFINGLVLSVPDLVSSTELADDYRVASVQEDQAVELQAISTAGEGGAGEGGAGEGGATLFVEPVSKLANSHRPWGILYVYGQPYNPFQVADAYREKSLDDVLVRAKEAKKLSTLKVALFDTGIDPAHSQLRDDRNKLIVRDGIDLITMTPGIPLDDNGHGTHVAGSLAATDLGMVCGVNLYAVKILDRYGRGSVSSLVMALQWAMVQEINVINMSIAFREDKPLVRLAVKKACEAGIIMVAAAGNHSNWIEDGGTGEGGAGEGGAGEGGAGSDATVPTPYPVMYPAAYPEVIAVGAMNSFEETADFSNTGPEVDVLAPGTDVISTNIGGYGKCSGTSMAAPHVTAAVTMMLVLDKNLTPLKVKDILKQTAVAGKLNLINALYRVKTGQ